MAARGKAAGGWFDYGWSRTPTGTPAERAPKAVPASAEMRAVANWIFFMVSSSCATCVSAERRAPNVVHPGTEQPSRISTSKDVRKEKLEPRSTE